MSRSLRSSKNSYLSFFLLASLISLNAALATSITGSADGVSFTTNGSGEYYVRRSDKIMANVFPFERKVAFVRHAGELRKKIPASLRKDAVLFDVRSLEFLIFIGDLAEDAAPASYIDFIVANALWTSQNSRWKGDWEGYVEKNKKLLSFSPPQIPNLEVYPGAGFPNSYQYMHPVLGKEDNAFMSLLIFDFPNFLKTSLEQSPKIKALLRRLAIYSAGHPHAEVRVEKNSIILSIDSEDQITVPLYSLTHLMGYISLDPKWDTFDFYKITTPDVEELWKGARKKPASYQETLMKFNFERDFFNQFLDDHKAELKNASEDNVFKLVLSSPDAWRLIGSTAEFLYAHPNNDYLFVSTNRKRLSISTKTTLPENEAEWSKVALEYWISYQLTLRELQFGIPSIDALSFKNTTPNDSKLSLSLFPINLDSMNDEEALVFKNATLKLTWNSETQEIEMHRTQSDTQETKIVKLKASHLLSADILFRNKNWLKRNNFLDENGMPLWRYSEHRARAFVEEVARKKRVSGSSDCKRRLRDET